MKLDHVTIRTRDLQAARNFFLSVFDLREGERPLAIQRRIPGHWLYSEGHPLVHIIGSQGSGFDRSAEAIDHVGLRMEAMRSFATSSTNSASATRRWTSPISESGGCSFARPAAHCWKPCFPNPFFKTIDPRKESWSCHSSRKCQFMCG
jgi:hypothetical protein